MAATSLKPWYQLKQSEMGSAVQTMLDTYKKEQGPRRERYVKNLELYEGRQLNGYTAYAYTQEQSQGLEPFARDRMRLIRSAVSTAVANIYAPQKPKPQFQTLGATWATRRKAYRLDRICEGVLNQRQGRFINVWSFMADAAIDAILQGCCPIKITADKVQKRIVHELVPHPDLFTDPCEGRNPKNLFQRAPLDESVALDTFTGDKARKAIMGAKEYEWYGRPSTAKARAAKTIEICYGWRLPNSPDDPGRWAAVINGECVDSGDWTAPAFPFVFLYWEFHRDGFWGSGIADEGGGLAEDCSDLDTRLQMRMRIAAKQQVYYQRDSLKPDDLTGNDPVTYIPIEPGAAPPTISNVPPFSSMEVELVRDNVAHFWDSIGISQVSAAARREPGVQSGIAMLTLNDTKAGRQLPKAKRYEDMYVDLAHQYVWRFRELAEDDPEFMVTWPGKSVLRQYNWAENDVGDEEFTVSVAASSQLPHDPAGRQEMVQEMYKAGLISQDTAREMIGQPDMDRELEKQTAQSEYIDMLIEKYLDAEQETWSAGDYEAPEGLLFNKQGAMLSFGAAWARARIDLQVLKPDEKQKAEFCIGLLVRYMRELDGLMKPPPMEAAPPGAAPPGAPGPMPPPGPPGGPPPPQGLPARGPGVPTGGLPPPPRPPIAA